VAAGFHPDLTGRENIFLQGAIMGMDKAHISRRLDEIIAFSEIESFIETPVKRFSSGMNARLGFAIAAHLDPDVLIIDEVLAVGDYSFQRKAFGRIRELARGGIPVVVVSHQLDRVSELCTDVLLLSRGAPVTMGKPSDVIGAYLRGDGLGDRVNGDGDASPVIIHEVSAPDGFEIRSGEFVRILVKGVVRGDFTQHLEPVGFIVRSAQTGEVTYCTGTTVCGLPLEKGEFELDVRMQMNVQPGIYLIDVGVFDRAEEKQLHAGSSLNVKVTEGTVFLGPTNMNAAMTLR
jgi:lipopolysaccharide transport system ATP-binding protein